MVRIYQHHREGLPLLRVLRDDQPGKPECLPSKLIPEALRQACRPLTRKELAAATGLHLFSIHRGLLTLRRKSQVERIGISRPAYYQLTTRT